MIKEQIVIINISNIGDIVSSLSVVKLLSKYYKIYFYTKEVFRLLVSSEDYLNIINDKELFNGKYSMLLDMTSSSISRKLVQKVKNTDLKYGLYSNIFNFIKQKMVYDKVRKKNFYGHIVKNYYSFIDFFNQINLNEIDSFPLMNIDSSIIFNQDKEYISIHIGARNPIRSIPTPLVRDIIDYIHTNFNLKIYILGDDMKLIDELLQIYPFVIYEKMDLNLLKVIIGKSKLFIGPDSGLLHIASSLNVESIGIYGPNIKDNCGPLNKKVSIVDKEFSCRPCNQNIKCMYDIRCLNTIILDDWFKELINKKVKKI